MPKRRKTYPDELDGYAGFTSQGKPAWGTFRPTREACAVEVERIAPTVEGFPPALRVLPVRIWPDLNAQTEMSLT